MMKHGRSRLVLLAALTGVTFPGLHSLAGLPESMVAIYPDRSKQLITDWGYDIKEPGKAAQLTPGLAKELFVEDKMTCLRVPIYGDDKRPAHPARGQVLGQYYRDILAAMATARSARADIRLFASKRLEGKHSFPLWVLNGQGVDPEPYAGLLADYLGYLEQQGFAIDILGVDNEMEYNGGNITPEKQKVIMDRLQSLSSKGAFTLPRHFIGPESYSPKPEWIDQLLGTGGGGLLDMVGTHYYPNQRPVAKLAQLTRSAQGRPVWLTELHWPDKFASGDVLAQAQVELATVFDATDQGVSGFVWWEYTRDGFKGEMEGEITRTLAGVRSVETIPGAARTLVTRAFCNDDHIIVWIVNDNRAPAPDHGSFHLATRQMAGPLISRQWTSAGGADGRAIAVDRATFTVPLPAGQMSITRVTIPTSRP